nr:MAG TPA: hypothetical protein [Caudoviricetes sp.]
MSKRLTKSALYSVASVNTTHKRIGLLWCPSSKAALFKFTLRYSGHRASMPLSQAVPNSPTYNRAMHIHCGG